MDSTSSGTQLNSVDSSTRGKANLKEILFKPFGIVSDFIEAVSRVRWKDSIDSYNYTKVCCRSLFDGNVFLMGHPQAVFITFT